MSGRDRGPGHHSSPLSLEHQAWDALSSDGRSGAAFFSRVLADDVLMLLPNGQVVVDREEAIELMSGAPWTSYNLQDERVLELAEHCAVVAYRVEARRGDQQYTALTASTYSYAHGAWRMAFHQQTPI